MLDDDDMLSDHEMENQEEANDDVDGNAVKFSKVVRGYEDADDDSQDEEEAAKDDHSESSGSLPAGAKPEPIQQGRKRTDSGASGVEKYTKPLRETHSKYLQYLRDIDFDKKNNVATINVAFPLNFKKVLMLTIAE